MRIYEAAEAAPHPLYLLRGLGVVAAAGGELALKPPHGLAADVVDARLGEGAHPVRDALAAAREVVQKPLEIARDEDVHARAGGEAELAPPVVDAGVDKVREDVVGVARADEAPGGQAHALGHPAGEDVPEVAGGHAEVELFAQLHDARGDRVAVGGEVIGYLRQEAAPVNGVRRGEEPAARGQLFGQGRVGENALHAGLRVVKIPLHGADADVPAALRDHLEALHVAHAVARVEDHNPRAGHVGEALERGLARVAARGDEDADALLHGALFARGGQQARQHLEGHVLKGARRPVPELKIARVLVREAHGRNLRRVEIRAVGRRAELLDLGGAELVEIGRHDARGARAVIQRHEGGDVLKRKLGEALGHVEPSVGREAPYYGLGGAHALGRAAGAEVFHTPTPIQKRFRCDL